LDTQAKSMRATHLDERVYAALCRGLVIPACPLALNSARKLDERRQRALLRYYLEAGAGGLAVAVHTTQFAIRSPQIGLFRPLLELAAEEMDRADFRRAEPLVRIAGVCGPTPQAISEAQLVRACGYHAGLLSLGGLKNASEMELIAHCRKVAEVIPLVGFYLQPAAGGRILSYSFGADWPRSMLWSRSRSPPSTATRLWTW
jgi:dihydrodipicolinate synthase/N-acetylneuraminate lyase